MSGRIEYVYFARADNFIKIGRVSKGSVSSRIRQLQCGCPNKIEVDHYMKIYLRSTLSNIGESVERYLQSLCSSGHCRGEWYYADTVEDKIFNKLQTIKEEILNMNHLDIYEIEWLSDIDQSNCTFWHGTIKDGIRSTV